jgi:hypothetical protein
MVGRLAYLVLIFLLVVTAGCNYRKGASYTWSETGDTVKYIVVTAGSGRHILNKMNQRVRNHKLRDDECRIIFVSDSAGLSQGRGILLFNSVLPDIGDDMLSKGFIGTFVSRQVITYLLVSRNDFENYFTPSD